MASSADATQASVVAALLWDVPSLQASQLSGAKAFVEALSPERQENPPEGDPADPLILAARFLHFQDADEPQLAFAVLDELAALGPWCSLLALNLAAFSTLPFEEASIRRGLDLLETITPSQLRAHLYLKLATFAYDRGLAEIFFAALERAEEAADPETRLGINIRLEHAGMSGSLPAVDVPNPLPPDLLVDLPWVTRTALAGAQEHLDKEVQARARRAWTWTFSAGRTPLDQAIAAERQLTWAGMLWDRRAVRRQVGSQILVTGAPDSGAAAYGLLMWLLGGGAWNEMSSVAARVEPLLTSDGVDEVLRHLFNVPGPAGWRDHAVARVAVKGQQDSPLVAS